jgi:cell division control protein 7
MSPETSHWERDVDNALDLLNKLMEPESIKRCTPRDALYHPFLREDENEDDHSFPHPFGSGVCADWHFIDDSTGELYVRIRLQLDEQVRADDREDENEPGFVIRRIEAGQGIAVGARPCEFHCDEPQFIMAEPQAELAW